jgi:hypothetical protein
MLLREGQERSSMLALIGNGEATQTFAESMEGLPALNAQT